MAGKLNMKLLVANVHNFDSSGHFSSSYSI